jgi:hypothetical protein
VTRRSTGLLSGAILLAAVASCAQAPVRPISHAQTLASHPDGLRRTVLCEDRAFPNVRLRVFEYRFESRPHLYFEPERREPGGAWRSRGVVESENLDVALAQRELGDISCRQREGSIEVWVGVRPHPWRRREVEGLLIAVSQDLSITFDELVVTGSD